jgi:hypothetical protein
LKDFVKRCRFQLAIGRCGCDFLLMEQLAEKGRSLLFPY